MLGPAKPRCLDRPVAASLEDIGLLRNLYRHLEDRLDLDFVRDWVGGTVISASDVKRI